MDHWITAAPLEVALRLVAGHSIEHPCLDVEPPDTGRLPPPTELLAELLLARFAEMQSLVARYNAAADDAIDARDLDDDLPF